MTRNDRFIAVKLIYVIFKLFGRTGSTRTSLTDLCSRAVNDEHFNMMKQTDNYLIVLDKDVHWSFAIQKRGVISHVDRVAVYRNTGNEVFFRLIEKYIQTMRSFNYETV